MAKNQRKCGECRKPGHTKAACPQLKAKATRAASKAKKAEEQLAVIPEATKIAMVVDGVMDEALGEWVESLPEFPDEIMVAEAALEFALRLLAEAHESCALANESILPRLCAFNADWASSDRQDLADLDADEDEDDEDWKGDDADLDDGGDQEEDEGDRGGESGSMPYASYASACSHNSQRFPSQAGRK